MEHNVEVITDRNKWVLKVNQKEYFSVTDQPSIEMSKQVGKAIEQYLNDNNLIINDLHITINGEETARVKMSKVPQ